MKLLSGLAHKAIGLFRITVHILHSAKSQTFFHISS